ncbi:MAG TPA: putative Ig domain-containing protein [Planctomycetota bacterium]|nr:putative Ig domain-containing protein [Planctomycetota bacterium]
MRTLCLLLLACAACAAQSGDEREAWPRFDAANRLMATDPAAGRAALEALLLDHPGLHAASYNLGCLLLDDDAEGAARRFQAATASPQPELSAHAWHNLALAHEKLGRGAEALEAAAKAVLLKPDDADLVRTRDELRRVLIARQDEARRAKEEEAKKLALVGATLPAGRVGEAYDQRLTARGGTPPYRFAPGAEATLPEGLALDADGRLHGTPTAAGKLSLPITVQDAATSVNGAVALEVEPTPAITTVELPEAIIGIDYRAELAAVGLDQPRWTVEGLRDGLRLEQDRAGARIVGTPTTMGEVALALRAADRERSAQATLPLAITDRFAPAEPRLPPATAWAPYTHRQGVRGPPQGYRWRHAAAQGGIGIAADGATSGAPVQAGDLELTTTIVADDGRARDVAVVLPVNPPPVIEVADPIAAQQGRILDLPLTVTGGTPPYAWSIAEGTLPGGLRLERDGALRGAPSEVGDFAITLQCADRWQATTQQKTTVRVEKPQDDQADKDDEKKDEQAKDDEKQDQQQQDGGEDQAKDEQQQPGEDQPGQGDQAKDDAKSGQGGQDDREQPGEPGDQPPKPGEQPPKPGEQQPKPGEQAKNDATDDAAEAGAQASAEAQADAQQQAQTLTGAAADRWLEQLPPEDRAGLRLQMLLDGNAPRGQGEQTW